MSRTARIERATSESKVVVEVDLDGSGRHDISTGVGFYDHMLTAFARHSLVDLTVQTEGDVHIDAHHTVEDTAIALGQAMREALGDKAGIRRFGDATVPLDEALVQAVVDVSGPPLLRAHRRARGPGLRAARRLRGVLPRLADPARLRVDLVPRPPRAARAGARRARAAPHRRDAVQGVRPGVPRRRRPGPPGDGRSLHQGHALSSTDRRRPRLRLGQPALGRARRRARRGRRHADRRLPRRRWRPTGSSCPASGAYAACMAGLRAVKGDRLIGRRLAGGRPVLGICVGMQVLFERGVEHGVETDGCDEWPGTVVAAAGRRRAPHGLEHRRGPRGHRCSSPGVEGERFYFVHSYAARTWDLVTTGHTRAPAGDLGRARRRPVRRRRRERPAVRDPVPPREVRRRRRGPAAQLGRSALVAAGERARRREERDRVAAAPPPSARRPRPGRPAATPARR